MYRVDDNGEWVGAGVDGGAPYRCDIVLPPAADINLVEIILR